MEPSLQEERSVTVLTLYETRRERQHVPSIGEAVDIVKQKQPSDAVCEKIITRDDAVVYSSNQHGYIEDWEAEWRLQLRVLSPSESTHQCPYRNADCIGNNLCVECTIDGQIERYSLNGDQK